MAEVRVSYSSILCALGSDTETVFQRLVEGRTGLKQYREWQRLKYPICASRVGDDLLKECFHQAGGGNDKTRLEQMMIVALHDVIDQANLPVNDRVGLVIGTTKGNVDALAEKTPFPQERAYLPEMGRQIADHFGLQHMPVIVSNACVSGIHAVVVAQRYIDLGRFDHVLVVGGDLLTEFVISGFHSFQALSPEPCRPYSVDRVGINLGEASVATLVTKDERFFSEDSVYILGSGSANDANHISGPSRTGEGLFRSVSSALYEANITPDTIDLISAHGTATSYNDEMESIAFDRAGLSSVPMHSLKGYFGHTLGAAGLLEAMIAMQCTHHDRLIASAGFTSPGTSRPLNVIQENRPSTINTFLKTASGFGGCNTAVVFGRNR